MAFDSTCGKSKWAQKMQEVIEKTEDFFLVLPEKGRSNPGAHTLARMWGRSTEMDMTFFIFGQDACLQAKPSHHVEDWAAAFWVPSRLCRSSRAQ